jgi:iron complex outermembrane recepter protein
MTRALLNCLLGTVALSGATIVSLSAHAQTQPRAAGPAADATGVSELVVTAEKRSERLQDVGASISVLTGNQLEQLHSTQLADWAPYVPGFNLGNAGAPGETFLSLDGIGPIGAASEVGVYVNETPIGSSSSFQGANGFSMDLMPYDLDRVEVLRGPQGTLYGASTMGGLIKYVLASPDLNQLSGRIGGDLFGVGNGNGPGGGARGEVNVPIIDGALGLRASIYHESTPGYIDNATTGQKGDNPLSQNGGRVALLWRPRSDVSVQLSATLQDTHADNQSFVALSQTTGQPLAGPLSNINARNEPYTQQLQLYDATVKWDFHWANLTSVSSYQSFKNHTDEDLTNYIGVYLGFFGGPGPGQADFFEHYRLRKFTQEVRLASPTDQRLEWMVGGYYTHESGENNEVFNAYDSTGAILPALNPLEFAYLPSTYEEYAIFGHVTYHFTRQFDITAGGRYAHNNQNFTEIEGGALLNPADPAAPVLNIPGRSSEGVATYSVSPRFHITDDMLVYARIASGYQPGGPNVILPSSAPGPSLPSQFNSSRLTDYQVGLKSTFLDGRANVDLSAFYIDWSKIQVSVLVGAESAIENAGAARSEGLDLNGTYSPIRGLVLGGSLAYTDAVLTSAVSSITAAKGARLPYVPLWSGSLTADYSRPIGGRWRAIAGAGYRLVGSRYSDVQGSTSNGTPQGLEARSYGVVDLHVGAADRDWTVTVFAKNLLDDRAYLAPSDYFNDALGMPIDIKAPVLQPRTVGLSVDRSF